MAGSRRHVDPLDERCGYQRRVQRNRLHPAAPLRTSDHRRLRRGGERLSPGPRLVLALLDDLQELLGVCLGVGGDNQRLLGDGVLAISQA